MLIKVFGAAVQGIDATLITIEVNSSRGCMFYLVGLPDSAVKESHQRIISALQVNGYRIPTSNIIINMAPADIRKEGSAYDLPLAIGMLAAGEVIQPDKLNRYLMMGELSLDGSLQPIKGALPIAIKARELGFEGIIVPRQNALEAAVVNQIQVYGVENIKEVIEFFNGKQELTPTIVNTREEFYAQQSSFDLDFADVKGQENVKRALEVAAAGGHNIILIGAPGSGKSMVAKRIPTILPPMQLEESMEVTKIYSVAGMVDREYPLITKRPFRSVHHTVTRAALIGGGVIPNPGEISLAHGGVLFLDELAEFRKPVLEVLRQPLEEHKIRISRNSGCYEYPADFMLIAAMNPCPCGNYPDLNKCNCTKTQIQNYLGHVSQPFLDRMDLCVEASRVEYGELHKTGKEETSAEIRNRVCTARKIQEQRYEGTDIRTNSGIGVRQMEEFCQIGEKEEKLMRCAFSTMNLTARTYHKVLKVARTIADLDGEEQIGCSHLKEALGYRMLDKKYWGR